MSSLSRRPQSPPAAPLDVDDLLSEILLRLPPLPSSLPRASAVCKRWRLLVSDPRFLRRFRIHHRRNPPLLGCFDSFIAGLYFVPTMEAPNRVPPGRFSFHWDRDTRFLSLGCRHGLVLIANLMQEQFVVWDPLTGDRHQVAIPPGFDSRRAEINGAVLRAMGGVHFQVVLVASGSDGTQHGHRAIARVYSSETGGWGNLISTPIPLEPEDENNFALMLFGIRVSRVPAVLVRDSLYCQITGCSSTILEFDCEKQSLALIRVPVAVFTHNFTVTRADGGGLGVLFVSDSTAHLWKRRTDCDGVASWVLARTIELDKLFAVKSEDMECITILGFAEENNVALLWTSIGLFVVQLQSLQFKKLSGFQIEATYHPFESVYPAGIGGEHNGAELLHNV